jgi:hypothetical protein
MYHQLLEVAMTTAFASLTYASYQHHALRAINITCSDGTPILLLPDALSYLCFFILVWWIWASQVCYNLRYRQADWLHRIWVLLQLVIFSSLAAFTRNFNITNGIAVNKTEAAADQTFLDLGNNEANLVAQRFRDARLPKLNARGISMAMASSRLLLLAQYIIGESSRLHELFNEPMAI